MHRDAHQIAKFAIQRVKLIAHDLILQLGHDKIGMRAHNVNEGGGVVAPELLEAAFFKREQRWNIARLSPAQADFLVALRGYLIIKLIIGVEPAKGSKAALQ